MNPPRVPIWKKNRLVTSDRSLLTKLALIPVPYTWWGFLSQIIFIGLIRWWWTDCPVPGYAVAALGVAAIIMSLRGTSFTKIEQVTWVAIAFFLFIIEITAIKKDRTFADAQHLRDIQQILGNFRDVQESQNELKDRNDKLGGVIDATSYRSLLIRNQRIRSELDDLSERVDMFVNMHRINMQGINDIYWKPIGQAESVVEKSRLKAQQVKEEQNETDRFEKEYFDKIEPKMIKLLRELLAALGEKIEPDNRKLAASHGFGYPHGTQNQMNVLRTLAGRLVPKPE